MLYKLGASAALKNLGIYTAVPATLGGVGYSVLGDDYTPLERFARGAGTGAFTGAGAYGSGKLSKELLEHAAARSIQRGMAPTLIHPDRARHSAEKMTTPVNYLLATNLGVWGALGGLKGGGKLFGVGTNSPSAKKTRSERAQRAAETRRKNREKRQSENTKKASSQIVKRLSEGSKHVKPRHLPPYIRDILTYGGTGAAIGSIIGMEGKGSGIGPAEDVPHDMLEGAGKGALMGLSGLATATLGRKAWNRLSKEIGYGQFKKTFGPDAILWRKGDDIVTRADIPTSALNSMELKNLRRQVTGGPAADILGTAIGVSGASKLLEED